jgi:hypothetical protein
MCCRYVQAGWEQHREHYSRRGLGRSAGLHPAVRKHRTRTIPRRHCSRAPNAAPQVVVGAREPPVQSVSSQLLADRWRAGKVECAFPDLLTGEQPPPGGQMGAARACHLDRLIQQSVLRPPAVTAVTSRWCRCALYESAVVTYSG